MNELNITWKEELKELSTLTKWEEYPTVMRIEILSERCDALLRRLSEQEQLIIKLMKR